MEPYQELLQVSGGILRDIFTMGARPIAALNSLRFGKISNGKAGETVETVSTVSPPVDQSSFSKM
ncbi:MAG: AIR synthase related protein [Ignavibacteria bacterium]